MPKKMSYTEHLRLAEEASRHLAEAIDYAVAWNMAEKITDKTTSYKGKGRPRKTDYDVWKHPFDGAIRSIK